MDIMHQLYNYTMFLCAILQDCNAMMKLFSKDSATNLKSSIMELDVEIKTLLVYYLMVNHYMVEDVHFKYTK